MHSGVYHEVMQRPALGCLDLSHEKASVDATCGPDNACDDTECWIVLRTNVPETCQSRAVMQMLVAGWRALGMVGRGQFVGIMGFASMDWLVSDIATTYVGGVMSPLPTNILVEDIKHLILEAEVSSCGVAIE